MEDSIERRIPQAIENTPFTYKPAERFFAEWCQINDGLRARFIQRKLWEQLREQGILIQNNQDQDIYTLYLPRDLRLWEMGHISQLLNRDTIPSNTADSGDKIQELGETFEKAGVYIWQYTPCIEDREGRQIAQEMAYAFYEYGLALQHKKRQKAQLTQGVKLSREDKQKLDEWFLGRKAYQTRLRRLGGNQMEAQVMAEALPSQMTQFDKNPSEEEKEEAIRQKLFKNYFKALARQNNTAGNAHAQETTRGPIQHLQDITIRNTIRAIETPRREMKTSIFIGGVDRLVSEIRIPNWKEAVKALLQNGDSFNDAIEAVKLRNYLEIPKLKAELKSVRHTGDPAEISQTELKIVQTIQRAVSGFTYQSAEKGDAGPSQPAKILQTGFVNCLGATVLGWGLLKELDIHCLYADVPKHAATVLVTSDGRMYWFDFTPGYVNPNCAAITPDMFEEPVDIAHLTEKGISFRFKEWNPYPFVPGKLKVTLLPPEIALELHICNTTGNALRASKRYEEAIQAYQHAIGICPEHPYPYNGLGNVLNDLSRYEEALKAFQKAISLDPEYAYPHNGMGNSLYGLKRYEKAIRAYQNAITLDPKYAHPQCGMGRTLHALGRYDEAIKYHQKAIELDPKIFHPHYGMGRTLHALGRYEEAIEYHQKAIELDDKIAHSYFGLGNSLYALGRYAEAIKSFQNFIELWQGEEYWKNMARKNIEEIEKVKKEKELNRSGKFTSRFPAIREVQKLFSKIEDLIR